MVGKTFRDAGVRRFGIALSALALVALGCNADGGGDGEGDGTDGSSDGADVDPDDGPDDGTEDGPDDGPDDGTDDDPDDGTDDGPADSTPHPGGMRRLLTHQYTATVAYLFGDDVAASVVPPEDPSVGHYDAMATLSSVPSAADIESYERTSRDVAEAVVADPTYLAQTVPCVVDGPLYATCYQTVAEDLGRLAWRRPLTAEESDRIAALGVEGQAWGDGDFLVGLQYLLTGLLQSPHFLYIVEIGQEGADGEPRQLDGYEMATRLSFFLVGRTPDAAALARAESGELDTEEGVRELAQDLLASAEAAGTPRRFFGEYLTVRDLPDKGKSAEMFPMWNVQLAEAMVEETMRLVDDIVTDQDASVLDLFTADYTYVNDELAALYGVSPTGDWQAVTLPAEQNRAGILTQAGWLSMASHPNVNSPTRRGVFVAEQLLCQEIPLPPPRANPQPVIPDPDVTLREALSQHVEDPACAACHVALDPFGFAFENYDPVGQYRTLDNGLPIDSTGSVDGVGQFTNAAELATLLAEDPRVPRCLINQVYAQGLGWTAEPDQRVALDAVDLAYGEADHSMQTMLVELVASPVFRQVDEPK